MYFFPRVPDLEIHFLRSFYRPEAIREIGGLLVTTDKYLAYTVSVYVTVECPYDFDNYPMDVQVCTYRKWLCALYWFKCFRTRYRLSIFYSDRVDHLFVLVLLPVDIMFRF